MDNIEDLTLITPESANLDIDDLLKLEPGDPEYETIFGDSKRRDDIYGE